METAGFDYDLPARAIAQHPVEPRRRARLLVDAGPGRPPEHRTVADLPGLVGPGDLLVVNNTRVLPARLHLRKATGGAAEVLLLERLGDGAWEALVRPGRRLPPGTRLVPAARPGRGGRGRRPRRRGGGGAGRGRPPARRLTPAPAPGGRRSPPAPTAVGRTPSWPPSSRHGAVPLPPVHHRAAGRRRALPDRVRRPARLGGRAHRRPPPHRRGARRLPGGGCRGGDGRAGGGPRHVPADRHRQGRGPHDARRALRRARGHRSPPAGEARRVVAVGTTVVRALESAAASGQPGGPHRAVHPPALAVAGGRRACSPTSTCPARRCWCWSTRSSAPAGATSTPSRWPTATGSCRSATPCC